MAGVQDKIEEKRIEEQERKKKDLVEYLTAKAALGLLVFIAALIVFPVLFLVLGFSWRLFIWAAGY